MYFMLLSPGGVLCSIQALFPRKVAALGARVGNGKKVPPPGRRGRIDALEVA
jgi:hypothetical protein